MIIPKLILKPKNHVRFMKENEATSLRLLHGFRDSLQYQLSRIRVCVVSKMNQNINHPQVIVSPSKDKISNYFIKDLQELENYYLLK